MQLVSMCEPIFLEVCRINRLFRQPELAASVDEASVRARFKAKLVDAERRASGTLGMGELFRDVKPAIVALMDDVVRNSRAPFAMTWQPLSVEMFDDQGWQQTFFVNLELLQRSATGNPNELSTSRLMIYYICLGLGFVGMHHQSPQRAREYMSNMQAMHLGPFIDPDTSKPLLPELEGTVNQKDFTPPSWSPVIPAVIVIGIMSICLIVGTIASYQLSTEKLSREVKPISRGTTEGAPQ